MGLKTVADFLNFCEKTLKNCGIEAYRSDCLFLVAYLQGVNPSLLPLEENKSFKKPTEFFRLLEKRCRERIPVPHLIGEWDCLGRTFKLLPKVLAPRPATELLVEVAIEKIGEKFPDGEAVGVEIGTGSGCISINLLSEFPRLNMVGFEIDPVAAENTLLNAKRFGVANRLELVKGDALKLLPAYGVKFDFLVSNPPYIAEKDRDSLPPEVLYENEVALFGGKDGTLFHRFVAKEGRRFLKDGGFAIMEFEPFQKGKILESFEKEGWSIEIVEDFAGYPRIIIASI
jgi:release factor glutamine methyltransferase